MAGRSLLQELNKYACTAWAYFSMKKSRQKSLGAAPQDPLTLSCGWIRMSKASPVQRRRYANKVPAAHFMRGNCKPTTESHAARSIIFWRNKDSIRVNRMLYPGIVQEKALAGRHCTCLARVVFSNRHFRRLRPRRQTSRSASRFQIPGGSAEERWV